MSENARMTPLAERKRRLVQEAALHRELLLIERRQIANRLTTMRQQLQTHRWWLLGGAVAIGLTLGRFRRVTRWLPTAIKAM